MCVRVCVCVCVCVCAGACARAWLGGPFKGSTWFCRAGSVGDMCMPTWCTVACGSCTHNYA